MDKLFILTGICVFLSCNEPGNQSASVEQIILNTEKAFMNMVNTEGVQEAFVHFADDSAVLVRNNALIKGKKAIFSFYDHMLYEDIRFTWTPDFVDVSRSGDMAYTYGKFHFSAVDSTGREVTSDGIFHTVWKKQPDGKWKFVYD